jgi:hypothetical protein
MGAVVAKLEKLFGVSFTAKPLPEPEPMNARPRPLTGFFASLTAEQQKAAMAYDGPEGHGEDELRAKKS